MKKFYKIVSTKHIEGGYQILLDDRPVKTPSKNDLLAPTEDIANTIMQEWADQDTEIKPETMPLTQIVSTRIDRVSQEREAMSAALLKYLNTDLICYHTDEPPELSEKQRDVWEPWLHWFETNYNTALETTSTLTALTQPEEAHERVRRDIKNLDDDHFTALQLAVPLCGSIILGLAFVKQAITADDLFAAARIEEHFKAAIYNEEKHGPDPAEEKKDQATLRDLRAAEKFLQLL